MNPSILPYGLPRACAWCERIIETDAEARNVMMHHKPFSSNNKNTMYGWCYEIVCDGCYNWSCEHDALGENQKWLMGIWVKDRGIK